MTENFAGRAREALKSLVNFGGCGFSIGEKCAAYMNVSCVHHKMKPKKNFSHSSSIIFQQQRQPHCNAFASVSYITCTFVMVFSFVSFVFSSACCLLPLSYALSSISFRFLCLLFFCLFLVLSLSLSYIMLQWNHMLIMH